MKNTSMMEDESLGDVISNYKKRIRRVEKGKHIEMRKDEKNEEKKL